MGPVCDGLERKLYANLQATLKIPQDQISLRSFTQKQLDEYYRAAKSVPNTPGIFISDPRGAQCAVGSRLRTRS